MASAPDASRGGQLASRRPPERGAPRRRARRRHQSGSWLQRNALSIAAVSILVALLAVAFGLLQIVNRPEPVPATATASGVVTERLAAQTADLTNAPIAPAAAPALAGPPVGRQIQSNVSVIEPNYTVQAGDTLARIAVQFNTTVERIEALNNLSDPRALRIGTRLVIPPALPQ